MIMGTVSDFRLPNSAFIYAYSRSTVSTSKSTTSNLVPQNRVLKIQYINIPRKKEISVISV